ncbi:MAG: biotin transporter BioY, partial [Bacteroidales bacterium]|nr:biotin transporter BioY [Bacteroidales bacterium]
MKISNLLKVFVACSVMGYAGAGSLQAQTIGAQELQQIKESFVKDANSAALQNMLTQESNIKKNTMNWDLQGKIDHYFKYRVNVKGITDQKSSGRCWMFTSMNVLRPAVMEKYNVASFDFSHNYNYFWDIFEKSNL